MFGLLRTTLAAMVMVYHLLVPFPALGQYAVFGFYVISGYLMTLVTSERYGHTAAGRCAFLANRVLRIYPGYLAAAALSLVVVTIVGAETAAAYNRNLGMPTTAGGWLANLTLGFPGWNPMETRPRLIPPAWTLTVELIFYAAIGLGAAKTPRRVGVWLAASLAYVAATFALGMSPDDRYAPVAAGALPFAIGALVYHLTKTKRHAGSDRRVRSATPWLFAATLANCGFFAAGAARVVALPADAGLYLNTLLCGALVHELALGGQIVRLPKRVDDAIGDLSYPVYLLHWPCGLMAAFALWGEPVRGWSPRGLVAFVLAALFVAAFSTQLIAFVEAPVQRWRRRLRPAPREAEKRVVTKLAEAADRRSVTVSEAA